jgi:integrase
MTDSPGTQPDISRQARPSRRIIVRALLRAVGSTAALVAIYYLLPLNHSATWAAVTMLVIGLVVLIALVAFQVRSIIASPFPGLRALTIGIRSEEARALRWDHVDLDAGTISVWRSVRAHGDVKTRTSRRTLALPEMAAQALRKHQELQQQERLNAGPLWQEHGLVFASTLGTPLDRSHVRRSLRLISRNAGIGEDWAPRDLRHTFVSIGPRRRPHRRDRTADRARRHPHHRNRVPARVAPGDQSRRGGDGSRPWQEG